MTNLANKTSIKVPFQLPEFIRAEKGYDNFVVFVQAYYEWMEQQDIGSGKEGAIYGTQNLKNYQDIDYRGDGTFNKFIDYYINDFLPNFPKEALTDKSKLVKIAKSLYQTKGTPASYQFLFRALYNSDADIFLTRDVVFRASDGKWYVSKSLRLATNDDTFLNIDNLRLFGETSKSIATVERGVRVGNRIEIYISNIERLFQSGEYVRVVDNNNQTIYFKNGDIVPANTSGASTLTAKILGSISTVQINSKKRGQLYTGRSTDPAFPYSGDPVVFYGGLNTPTGIGAKAYVNETTLGSLRDIELNNGSYGYREDPNTYIKIVGGGGKGAIANVGSVDPAGQINVTLIPKDYLSTAARNQVIGSAYTVFPANNIATIKCSLANAFSFVSFSTYPIASVLLNNGGGGFRALPTVTAESLYDTLDPQTTESLKTKGKLGNLGILGPIQIVNGGTGYANGKFVTFSGGTGTGANATIGVNGSGTITSVAYQYIIDANNVTTLPKGGLGYENSKLPTLGIESPAGGTNAVLKVNTVLGDGATMTAISDERGIGAITSFVIENYGEDYISAPNVSLRVRDLVIANVTPSNIVQAGEQIYQGTNIDTAVFKAYVDSITLLEAGLTPETSKYLLRTYNYTSTTKTNLQLKVTDREAGANLYLDLDTTYNTFDSENLPLFENGIRTYGNGAAQATAKFLNGLIVGQGQYLKDDGFPSSNQVLEDQNYNNFTYELRVQESFAAYKDILYKLVHPSGTKVVPINTMKSEINQVFNNESFESQSLPLSHFSGSALSNAALYSDFTNTSNNIVNFGNMNGKVVSQVLSVNDTISISTQNGPNVYSEIISINDLKSTAVMKDNVFLSFANVAIGQVTTSNDRINITSITDSYDIINNGEYSNTANKMRDIIFAGDRVRVYDGVSQHFYGTVLYVSYSNNVVFANTTLPFTSSNAKVSVGRTINSTDVSIYNTST